MSFLLYQLILLLFTIAPIVLLLLDWYVPDQPLRTFRQWITPLLFGLVGAAFWFIYGSTVITTVTHENDFIEPWHNFHYYLNAKYFDELGYFDLYSCAWQADQESAHQWGTIALIRDLRTYELVAPSDLPECPVSNFTSDRWEAFKDDFVYLQSLADVGFWSQALQDKGFNPSPFWVVVGGTLANWVPLNNTVGIALLFNLDVLLLAVALIVAAWSVGLRTALCMGLFSLLYFGTFYRLMGNFLQYSWLSAIIIGVCFWHKGKQNVGSVFLAYASVVRIFPAFLLLGAAIQAMYERTGLLFLKRFVMWCMLFVAIGSLTGRESYAWYEFVHKMKLHSSFIVGESLNMGLRNFIVTLPVSPIVGNLLYLLLVLVAGYLFVHSVKRGNILETIVYSAVFVYFVLTLSPYYFQIFILVPLLYRVPMSPQRKADTWGRWSLIIVWLLLAVNALANVDAFVSLRATAKPLTEISLLLFCLVILVGGVGCSNASGVYKSQVT